MTDKTYSGWTNYATWRVNLEIFDGLEPDHFGLEAGESMQLVDEHELADAMESFADEILCQGCGYEGLVLDYARAFLQDVNWREIAQHFINDYAEA
jgi:hypothetical protein